MDYYHPRWPKIFVAQSGALFDWDEQWESPCSDRFLHALGMPDVDRMGRAEAIEAQNAGVNFNSPAKKLKAKLD